MLQAHASGAAELPQIPRADLAPGLSISRVIKGNWQLSGGHKCVLSYASFAAMHCHFLAWKPFTLRIIAFAVLQG